MYNVSLINVVRIFLFFVVIDATFLNEPANDTACIGSMHHFPWDYNITVEDAFSVVWSKDGSSVLTWTKISPPSYTYGAGYSAERVKHNNNNGDITIFSLTLSDAGAYKCTVTYISGATSISKETVLTTSNCSTVTTEMASKSSSLDQTSSSQNPSTDTSKTQNTETNRMSTTDSVLTSTSLHFTSDHEVTTQILNRSNISMTFSVGVVIAIAISGIILVCLVGFLVCLYLRRKHTRKRTSETPQPRPRRTNEKQIKEQYSRKNFRGQTIPSTYSSDYFDSGNPRTKTLNKISNHKQRHKNENENLDYELSQSIQNNIEDIVDINYPSSRNHQTRANNRRPSIPLAHFTPEYSKNYKCVSYKLYVDPHETNAYMYQGYIVYPTYNRVQDRQSGERYYS